MKTIKNHFLFILFISILAILFGYNSNLATFLGEWGTAPDKTTGLIVTITFLLAIILYGIIMGYSKKRAFVKFISLYWGIAGLIGIIAALMAPIGKFAIIVVPVEILTLVPTYGLKYFSMTGTLSQTMARIVSSWSAGAIGYLIGYLLRKLKIVYSGIDA